MNIITNKRQSEILIAIGLSLVSLLIALLSSTSVSLAFDDPFSVFYSRFPPEKIISYFSKGNNPPAYELFLHYWSKIFGTSVLAYRMPSMLSGAGAVYLLCRIGWKYWHPEIGVLAASLMVLSSFFLQFQLEVRGYSIAIFLSLIYLKSAIELYSNRYSFRHFMQLVLSGTLLLYFHYFGIFPVILIGVFLWLSKPSKKVWIFLFSGIFILLLYLPQINVVFSRINEVKELGTWIQLTENFYPLYLSLNSLINYKELNINLFILFSLYSIVVIAYSAVKEKWIRILFLSFGIYWVIFLASFRNGLNLFLEVSWIHNQLPIALAILFFIWPALYWRRNLKQSDSQNEYQLSDSQLSWALLMYGGISVLIVYLLSWNYEIYFDRYLFFTIPIFFLLLAFLI